MYMDDVNNFSWIKKELENLIQTFRIFDWGKNILRNSQCPSWTKEKKTQQDYLIQ